jgi:hypothetical protein
LIVVLVNVVLLEVFDGIVFDLVDKPDVMVCLHLQGRQQHLDNGLSIVL